LGMKEGNGGKKGDLGKQRLAGSEKRRNGKPRKNRTFGQKHQQESNRGSSSKGQVDGTRKPEITPLIYWEKNQKRRHPKVIKRPKKEQTPVSGEKRLGGKSGKLKQTA